jgi:hypothetical protein
VPSRKRGGAVREPPRGVDGDGDPRCEATRARVAGECGAARGVGGGRELRTAQPTRRRRANTHAPSGRTSDPSRAKHERARLVSVAFNLRPQGAHRKPLRRQAHQQAPTGRRAWAGVYIKEIRKHPQDKRSAGQGWIANTLLCKSVASQCTREQHLCPRYSGHKLNPCAARRRTDLPRRTSEALDKWGVKPLRTECAPTLQRAAIVVGKKLSCVTFARTRAQTKPLRVAHQRRCIDDVHHLRKNATACGLPARQLPAGGIAASNAMSCAVCIMPRRIRLCLRAMTASRRVLRRIPYARGGRWPPPSCAFKRV